MRVRRRSDHLVPRGRDSPSGTSSARRSTAYAATTKSRSRPHLARGIHDTRVTMSTT